MENDKEKLERALRFAAGMISTMDGYNHMHPQDVLEFIKKEANKT